MKGRICTFKNINNDFVHLRILYSSRLICYFITINLIYLHLNYLICITNDSKIRIVCDHDNLPFLFCSLDEVYQISVHTLIVKIFFWLIYNQRFIIHIDKEV